MQVKWPWQLVIFLAAAILFLIGLANFCSNTYCCFFFTKGSVFRILMKGIHTHLTQYRHLTSYIIRSFSTKTLISCLRPLSSDWLLLLEDDCECLIRTKLFFPINWNSKYIFSMKQNLPFYNESIYTMDPRPPNWFLLDPN